MLLLEILLLMFHWLDIMQIHCQVVVSMLLGRRITNINNIFSVPVDMILMLSSHSLDMGSASSKVYTLQKDKSSV